jgi:autotransporter-associated beta strand protein
MKKYTLSVVALLLAMATTLPAAVSTWLGTNSVFWTNAVNWSPGLPASGDDVVIANITSNNLTLTDPRTIGNLQFGTTGTRTAGFQIRDNVASQPLTFTNGFTANGALATTEFFFVPIVIANDQTWSIGGAAGSATADAGIRIRERATGVQTPVTLNGTLTKSGPGQLSFVGNNISGSGNIVVNQGSVKLNAGGTTLLTVGGTGSITVNSNASLLISRNSGSWNFTRAVVANSGSTVQFGGGSATSVYGMPITWDGNVTLSVAAATDNSTEINIFTNTWAGTAAITTANANAGSTTRTVFFVLSNNIAGWTGSLNNAINQVRIGFAAPTPGNPAVAWSLNNANATLETYGAANVQLGSLAGASGTLRNSDPASQPATVTVGALNTSTTFGAVMADNTSSLGLVKVGTGTLTLTGNNTFSGGTTVSNGTVLLQGSTANIGSGSVAVRSGATFGGSGNANSTVTVDAGGTIRAAGGIGAPPLNVGILTLGNGSTEITTSEVDAFLNGKIVCVGGLTVNGTNVVNITGAVPPVGVYDLITYTGVIGGNGFAGFKLGALPPGVVANLQDSGSAIQLNVTQTGESGIWVGNVLAEWNLAGGLEWKGATSGNPQAYLNLYPVSFNDSASNFTVTVTENVTPAIVNLNHATDYTFTGAGAIIGTAGLTKDGPGKLTILNSNTYSGGTFITNGTVQLGNGGTSGAISGLVNNDGILVFNRSDAITFASGISGAGSIEQRGTGFTTVGGANSYTGLAIIASGTLVAGSGSALGVTNSGTVVSNTATLDVNSQSLGAEPINAQGAGVGGAGAIVNNGPGDQTTATRYVTLDGPTTFGGARRWDIRVPTVANDPNGGNDAFLHGNGHNLTKVSSNVVAFISAGDTALGDIDIQGGTLTFSRSTYMGDPAKKITVRPGATLQLHRTSEFFNPNILSKVLSLTNATFAIEGSGLTNNQFAGPVTLSDSNVINLPAATGLILTGPVNGSGSATVIGPGTLVVSGSANYTGGTTVNGAVLQVDGTMGDIVQPLTIISPSTIGGNGTIKYAVTVPSGSVLSPGAHSSVSVPGTTLGGLTINNTLILQAGCSNVFEINKDAGTNDTVRGLTSVTMAGTLFLQNVGSTAYAPGDNFKLFSAGSFAGGFSSIVPATPAAGLIWLTNSLTTSGTLGVAVLPNPIPLKVFSSSSLISNEVNVIFSAELDPSTSQDPGNYTISTGQGVTVATLRNGTNVVLTLDSPISNLTFTVNVKSVRDLAYVPNEVVATNVPSAALGFQESVSVLVTNGSAFAYGTNQQIKVYSDGVDIFGTQDEFQFVYKNIEGDFDFSVRLESFLISDPAAKAGIMAREISDPNGPRFDDRHFLSAAFTPDPTRNNNFVQYRDEFSASAVAPAAPRPPAYFPNNWLRLKRTGAVFQGYSGPDGLNWAPMSAIDTSTNASGPFPSLLRVGLAVTSHNRAQTTEAVFSEFGPAKEAVPLTATISGNNVVVTWPAGTGTTLQATPSLSPPVTWTNVPGSELTSQAVFPISSGDSFFRLVK